MALRGTKPEAITKRLKCLFYGEPGTGKTMAAIQFPSPYLIDTERGAENKEYVDKLNASGGAYFFTADFDELLQELTSLMSEEHKYRTLVIDPLTVVYNDLLDKSAKALATKEDPGGMAFGRHKVAADRKIKHLLNLLLRLDMNVIITSHAKIMWGEGMTKLGNTFDCYAKLDYLFDLVFEVQKRGKDNRVGMVKKTRVAEFPEGEVFPFSYAEIAKRYGASILEAVAKPLNLATSGQIVKLNGLIKLLKLPEETTEKWLDKAGANSFAELTQEQIGKCISFCEGEYKKATGEPETNGGKKTAKAATAEKVGAA